MGFDDSRTGRPETFIDRERLSEVLRDHPVRLGVLFGSRVEGTDHVDSDVDLAVEFEPDAEPEDALLPLLADLSSATGGVDVDVAVLPDLEPRIGLSVCRNGVLLVGERDRFESHCQRFREQHGKNERRPARNRFHEIVETAKQAVGQDA